MVVAAGADRRACRRDGRAVRRAARAGERARGRSRQRGRARRRARDAACRRWRPRSPTCGARSPSRWHCCATWRRGPARSPRARQARAKTPRWLRSSPSCPASPASPRASARRSLGSTSSLAAATTPRRARGPRPSRQASSRRARAASSCSPACASTPTSRARCGSTPTSRCSTTRTASSSRSATTSTRAGSTLSYYDLLASECRLASFLAIAKGDVPQEHWFRLGRALTKTGEGRALVSWSASMFEYLMPLLVMRDWPSTLLAETYETVVRSQIAVRREPRHAVGRLRVGVQRQGRRAHLPVPGVRRAGPGPEARPLRRRGGRPLRHRASRCRSTCRAVVANLAAFSAEGAEGRYGYYEALDYTPGRVPAGESRAVVKSYFAHHQGMAFVALGNALFGGRMRDRFHADPDGRLLGAAAPGARAARASSWWQPHVEEVENVRSVRELPPPVTRSYSTAETPVPATHFLSNGRYSVMVTNGGGGYSPLQRRRGQPLPRRPHARLLGHVLLRARHRQRRGVLGTLQPAPGRARRLPRDLRARQGRVPPHRRRPGDARGDRRLARGRRRGPAPHDHQPRPSRPPPRHHVVLRGRARGPGRRPGAQVVLQPVRRDAVAARDRRGALHAPSAPQRRAAPLGPPLARLRGGGVRHRRSRPTARRSSAGCAGPTTPSRSRSRARWAARSAPCSIPCCSLRRSVTIPGGESVRLVFSTGIASDRESALRLTEKYPDIRSAQRAIDLAWTAAPDRAARPRHHARRRP